MNVTINKSQLMRRAWKLYRMDKMISRRQVFFADALRRAWKQEKQEAEMKNCKPVITKTVSVPSESYATALIGYYATGNNESHYFGD